MPYILNSVKYHGKEVWYATLHEQDRVWGELVDIRFTGIGTTPNEAMQHANALHHTHTSELYQVMK